MIDFLKNKFLLAGMVISILVAGLLSFYATSHPDGLETGAEEKGFLDTAKDPLNSGSPLADYGVSGVDNERLSVGLSGILGVAITLVVSLLLFRYLAKRGK